MISSFSAGSSRGSHPVGALLILLALTACSAGHRPDATPGDIGQQPETDRYVFACPDGLTFSALYQEDAVTLTLPDRVLNLPRAISASGARYAAGDTVFWAKGQEARLETPVGTHSDCVAHPVDSPWEEASLLGYSFRGIGQEPGWTVEIDPGDHIRLVLDYGERRLHLPAPEPVRDPSGAQVYETQTSGHSVTIRIEETPCQDTMSGEAFTHTVTASVDGKEYQGCGRELSTGPLIGTHWALIQIEGRPAIAGPGGEAPFIQLLEEESRLTGNTGCNLVTGGYETEGDRLEFGRVGITRRACVEPDVAQQEQSFTRVLEATNRYEIRGGVLVLYQDTAPLARLAAQRAE